VGRKRYIGNGDFPFKIGVKRKMAAKARGQGKYPRGPASKLLPAHFLPRASRMPPGYELDWISFALTPTLLPGSGFLHSLCLRPPLRGEIPKRV
jgi:hypothetical protein